MTKTALQDKTVIIYSQYLPTRELFIAIKDAANIFIDGQAAWQKQTLANRAYILGANGVHMLSVPVKHSNRSKTKVIDICIDYNHSWIRAHKGAIFSAYNTSPFFSFFRDDLFDIYDKKPKFLYDLNIDFIQLFLKKLRSHAICVTSEPQMECTDLRLLSSLNAVKNCLPQGESYTQVFSYKFPFSPFLSTLDVLSNVGRL